jgi:hypothetical protein
VLINDILDLSKIEADRLELESAPYAPAHVVEEVLHMFALSADQRGLHLVQAVAADVPAQPPATRGACARSVNPSAMPSSSPSAVRWPSAQHAGSGRFRVRGSGFRGSDPGDRRQKADVRPPNPEPRTLTLTPPPHSLLRPHTGSASRRTAGGDLPPLHAGDGSPPGSTGLPGLTIARRLVEMMAAGPGGERGGGREHAQFTVCWIGAPAAADARHVLVCRSPGACWWWRTTRRAPSCRAPAGEGLPHGAAGNGREALERLAREDFDSC